MNTKLNKLSELNLLIGNTPMIGINYSYKGKEGTVYVKCENYNLTGSIKDRIALYILKKAYESGALKPEDTIVEATSGNAGIAFCAVGRMLGHKVCIIMPDWMSMERKLMIQSFGADIIPISKEKGGFVGSIKLSQEMAANDPHVFLPCQFSNCNNIKAHQETTGPEIITQLQKKGLSPDVFVAGVGTGGTVMGVGKLLKSLYSNIKVHPLEPEESPTLSTGYKIGSHRIQGISDEFIPEIMYEDKLDNVIQVSDGDSILMAQKLACTLGLPVGISSGANLVGAIKLQQQYGLDSVIATVFPDCNKKYLSTDLMRKEPVKEHYLSPYVDLLNFTTFDRVN
ncbi:MAG: PLP-dependent cysteine synthase family protein [Prevotellaceae bacterium]|jgi:cysteine synthase A|nr:PLP-dependent cysteine synthase family protein [Prevotellaceae bacterium]